MMMTATAATASSTAHACGGCAVLRATSRWRGTRAGVRAARAERALPAGRPRRSARVPAPACPRERAAALRRPRQQPAGARRRRPRHGGLHALGAARASRCATARRARRSTPRPALPSPKVARFAAKHDLAGAEFLAGIPGTVGGALAMNAGCYGGETWDARAHACETDRPRRRAARPRTPRDYRRSATATSRRGRRALAPATNGSSPRGFASRRRRRRERARAHQGAAGASASRRSRSTCRTRAACSAIRRATTRRG